MQSTKLFQKLLSNPITKPAARNWGYKVLHPKDFPMSTYNDLPSPAGSWQTHYDAKQRKYNAHLALGIAALIGSIVIAKSTGLLNLNYDHPDAPGPRE